MKRSEKYNKMNTKQKISHLFSLYPTITQKSIEMNYELIVVIIHKTIFIHVHDTYDVDDDDDEILSFSILFYLM